jgi:hypothetical protein
MPLQIVASDSQPGRTLTYSATGLPPGISINSSTGLITGTPTVVGNYSVTVTATDNVGIQGVVNFAWSITAAASGQKGTVGVSARTPVYGTTYTNQATTFDTRVGRPMAVTSWKAYFSNVSSYPITINNPQPIGEASALGAKALISIKPAVDTTNAYTSSAFTAEAAKVASMINLLNTSNVSYDIVFYNEMNNASNGFTGANGIGVTGWLAFWKFYAKVVHQNGGTVSWCPAITNGFPNAMPYFPNTPFPDKVHYDWYGNDLFLHNITPVTYGLSSVCDTHNIPLGIGEFGPSNDPTKFSPTPAQWYNGPSDHTSICQTVIDYFTSRLTSNKNNTDIIYFSDVKSTTSIGYVPNSSDYKVPGLQAIFDALNA